MSPGDSASGNSTTDDDRGGVGLQIESQRERDDPLVVGGESKCERLGHTRECTELQQI